MDNYLEHKRKIPIFAASNICFDYAAECGEQGLIDTAPFKSHLRVAFYFSCFFLKIFIEADCYILAFQ